jgi:hypothetical protein
MVDNEPFSSKPGLKQGSRRVLDLKIPVLDLNGRLGTQRVENYT